MLKLKTRTGETFVGSRTANGFLAHLQQILLIEIGVRLVSIADYSVYLVSPEVTCGTPPPVKYARVTDSCVSRGCVVRYRCDVGYESNEVKSECLVDGDWTRVSLNCTRE